MPDNNIEWGQGGVNNSNDWGKAKANSTNNFGAVYDSSPSGDTNIAGGQPVVSITYSASAFCADASDPTPTIQNNAGAGTFSSTTGLVFISTTTGEVDIDASTVGSYLITYTDTDAATATFNLTINALPTVIVSVSAGTICNGESTILTASGASTYVWNDGNTDNPRTVSPTTTTTFTATGTDSNGCTSSGGTTITVNALPTVSISGTLSYCAGASTTLDAGSFVSYLWSNGETTQTISATAGNYTVTVTDSNGCSNTSAQVTVSELALPTVAISGTLSYCAGSNTTLTATAGLSSYLWSSGETTQSITATAGSYTVTGTDSNGCSTTSSSVTVTETALDDSSFTYASNTYRQDESDPSPTISGLTGGTFSGTTGLVIDSSTGIVDLSASTIASHTITYDTTSVGNDCPTSSTFALAVTSAISPAFNYSASAYCQDASDPTPTITGTSGGTFSASPLFTGLLDTYTGSEAAYSLRRLSSTYTGNLIRVTKKVSNVISTTDIGYNSSNELDTTALATFASGADNGEVRVDIWYDQSGNSNNASNSTFTLSPYIYQSGSLITENSKPAIKHGGSLSLTTSGTPISSIQSSAFIVNKLTSTANYNHLFYIGDRNPETGYRLLNVGDYGWMQAFNSSFAQSTTGDLHLHNLVSFYNDSNTLYYRYNGASNTSISVTPSAYTTDIKIGVNLHNANQNWGGTYQEFIFYPSNQSSNLTGIETNIKNYHGI